MTACDPLRTFNQSQSRIAFSIICNRSCARYSRERNENPPAKAADKKRYGYTLWNNKGSNPNITTRYTRDRGGVRIS